MYRNYRAVTAVQSTDHVVLTEGLVSLAGSDDVRDERLPVLGPLPGGQGDCMNDSGGGDCGRGESGVEGA